MIRSCLKGKQFVPIDQAFEVIESKHHGHVKAVIKAMEKLEFKRLIASRATQERNLVEALIAARILAPNSKLATIRWWETTTLPEMLGHVDMTNQKLHALDIKTKLASLRTAIC